jgi:cholest-4-en-3-one 26-monooxygenase
MRLSDVDLTNLDAFERGVPHEMFRLLRREAPVFRHEESDGPGFWAITRYADLKAISRQPLVFSSERMGALLRDPLPQDLPMLRAIMLNMDPPRHRQYRKIVNLGFTRRRIEGLRPRVREMVDLILDAVVERGECDFVEHIAAPLPMQVICEMMGVPEEDRRRIYEIGNRMVGFDDPDLGARPDAPVAADYQQASAEMFLYANKLKERAARSPGDDLVTALLHAEVEGEKLSDLDFNSFFLLLAIAGNETTRTVTTNGMLALIQNPAERARLLARPALIPSAVEEILRFAPAVLSFRRTVTRDTMIRGTKIRENDKVVLWYPSANRDEEIFAEPDRFDVTREPNDHLAFGVGEHYCLGANLARMELQEIFRGILARLPDLELAAAPRRLRSNFINGVKEMRVRFTPSAARAA